MAASANIGKYPKTSSNNNSNITKESSGNYPITSLTNTNSNADTTSIDNIDEWLKELSRKSKERRTSSYKRQHKRHR